MRLRGIGLTFALIASLLMPSAAVSAPETIAPISGGSESSPAAQLPQPEETTTDVESAAPAQPESTEAESDGAQSGSARPNSSPETQPGDKATQTPEPSPAATQTSRARLAASSDTVSEISIGAVTMLVRRLATGTGHGTSGQCAINSQNEAIFPDGNAAGKPADDSAADEYTCWLDSSQYQIEFNFGDTGLDQAQRVKFTFNYYDQGLSVNAPPYSLAQKAEQICTSATDGSYTVVPGSVSSLGYRLTCEYEFKPGLSGSLKLPTLDLVTPSSSRIVSPWIKPTMTVNDQDLPVPPVTILSLPQLDLRTADNGAPQLVVVDGQPGMVLGFKHQNSYVPFPSGQWHPTHGSPLNSRGYGITIDLSYKIGLYNNGSINDPLPIPAGAQVLNTANSGVTYLDADGNPIATKRAPSATQVGLWLPMDVYREIGGIGVWGQLVPNELGVPNGPQNFGKDEPWDPGTGEACDFPTSSLGYTGVRNGTTTPNNNCYAKFYSYGEYTTGKLDKQTRLPSHPSTSTTAGAPIEVILRRAESVSTSDTYALCDTWDSAGQTALKRGAPQYIDLGTAAQTRVKVEPGTHGKMLTVPADALIIEYAASEISLNGSGLQKAVTDRCAATTGWTTEPDSLGADNINTVRFTIDRAKLNAYLKAEGYSAYATIDPETHVNFKASAPKVTDVAEGSAPTPFHDHLAIATVNDGVHTATFINSKTNTVNRPSSSLAASKKVENSSTHSTLAGKPVTATATFSGYVVNRDSAAPNKYRFVIEDELPACIDGAPTDIEFQGREYASGGVYRTVSTDITPAEGNPCYEDGPGDTPGKIRMVVELDDVNPSAIRHDFGGTLSYKAQLLQVIEPGKSMPVPLTVSLLPQGQSDDDPIAESLKKDASSSATITITPGAAETLASKAVADSLVRTGEDITWTLSFRNSGSGGSGAGEWIDVLPHDEDGRQTRVSSAIDDSTPTLTNLRLGDPVWGSTTEELDAPDDVTVRYAVTNADPATIVADPADPSNAEVGPTQWCWISAENECAEQLRSATALRVAVAELPAYSKVDIPFTANTKSMRDGSKLYNNLGLGRVDGLSLPVPATSSVKSEVYDLLIDGVVWYDTDASETIDEGENRLKDVTVELVDADNKVVATATTNDEGYYHFGQGTTPDGSHPGSGAEHPLFLIDGTYKTRVLREDGVILAEWEYTFSGNNHELNGTSAELELGQVADEKDFPRYQRADFGLRVDAHVSWKKVDENSDPLAGATFTVSADGQDPITVTDNGELDLDPADGALKVKVGAPGEYTVTEVKAPEGYEGTTETLVGTVTEGEENIDVGELVNTKLPEPEPTPSDESTDDPTDDPTEDPTDDPIGDDPSEKPTDEPTGEPSEGATDEASDEPTAEPSTSRTDAPTASATPTAQEPADQLPRTGAQIAISLAVGALLLLAGAALLILRRRQQIER